MWLNHVVVVQRVQLGITVITVAQRPMLEQFHQRVLTLPGDGSWEIKPVDSDVKTALLRTQSRAIVDAEASAAAAQAEADAMTAAIDARSKDYEGRSAPAPPAKRTNMQVRRPSQNRLEPPLRPRN